MSGTLSSDGDTSSRDPFRLDRLADELANRESSYHATQRHSDEFDGEEQGELPEHIPLSHDDEYLTAEVFNVEEFLLARSHTSLPDLRAELRQYLAHLKEELVKLINDDYEAFISLSTDLRDEGARLGRLKQPLGSLKENVLESKQELQAIQNEIHDKLTKRARLREEKALLHLLLKISEYVTRLESLLLITSPEQSTKESMELNSTNFLVYPGHNDETSDEKFRGNRAKHLGRVSAEYTQLLYHVRKARAEKCAFVNEVQWRIDRVQSTLSSDLDQLFAQVLTLLTDPKGDSRGTELERSKWIADLTECLRTYDVLGLWRDAEDVIRREVVRPFVKKTIYPGALMAPPSPLVPHTPFHLSGGPDAMPSATPVHQIPYTPFTAFVPKQGVHRLSGSSSDLPQVHLLEDADDSLARLYNQLLRFVERDIGRLMDIAGKISMKTSEARTENGDDLSPNTDNGVGEGSKEFQILANVVWDELGRSIMDEIGAVVFAAGRPNEFRKHYETTQAFFRTLELLAPSMEAVEAMRRHPTYLAFERRWQLPVYFQLRWKEIVGTLEEMLSAARLEPIAPKDGSFAMPQSSATWIAISACWSSDIYIPELSHRFWRLTLQILSRYKGWMEESLASIETLSRAPPSGQQERVGTPPNPPRASTPGGDIPSAETTAADDASLRYYAAAIIDIKIMETNVLTLWRQVISMMMPDTSDDEEFQTEDALRESISALITFVAPLSSKIIAILTKRCCDGLLPVRSIPSQFRAMSNKRNPTEPSYFVSSILRPVKQFFAIGVPEGPGSLLKDVFLKSYSTEIFNNVTQRYISYLAAMKKTEESLKRLKKGKKSTFSLFGNTANANDEGKDEERIRSQMILDADAFGKEGESLHVEVDTNPHFLVLKEMVFATDPE
ncbi:COG complex component [Flammula alnicola]|nr:COG complex component [Flammula alnicola]